MEVQRSHVPWGNVGHVMAWGGRRVPLVLVLVLAACDSSFQEAADPGRVVIEYWHQPMVKLVPGLEQQTAEVGDFERYLAKQFMVRHPEVVVRTQCLNWEDLPRKVPISVLGGRPPDVLMDYVGRTSGYWYQGILEPLDHLFVGHQSDFRDEFLSDVLLPDEGGRQRMHSVPLCGWVQLLAVNRAIWDRRGLGHLLPTREDPTWTFSQFETALEAVAIPGEFWPLGMQVASEQGDYRVLQFFWAHGAEIYHDRDYSRTTINSPQGVAALEWLVKAHRRGWIQRNVATAGNSLYDMFWRGNIGCLPSGLALRRSYEIALRDNRITADVDRDGVVDFDLMFTLPPTRDGVETRLPYGTNGISVFRQQDPRKRRLVFEFVRFLSRASVISQYARAADQLGSRKSAGNPFADQPDVRRVCELAAECKPADMGATSPHYYDLRKRLPPQLQFAFLGLKTPAEALADFESEAKRVLGPSFK